MKDSKKLTARGSNRDNRGQKGAKRGKKGQKGAKRGRQEAKGTIRGKDAMVFTVKVAQTNGNVLSVNLSHSAFRASRSFRGGKL
jgi:hypothetical protein